MDAPDSASSPRAALTLRGIEREYHVSRDYLSHLVRKGELPAIRRGRALVVLRSDLEAWWRRAASQRLAAMTVRAEAVVERALDRRAAR